MTPTPLEFACTLALILSGCSLANRPPSAAHDFPPVKDAPATAAVAAFRDRARTNGSITFRSWNGQALRMDSDTELTFYPDGSVHMFEWGFGLMAYSGSYRYPDGRVIVSFQEFEHGWPVMVIDRDEASLLLRPKDPHQEFVMGNRAGATLPGGKGSYWPFRMLTGDDEREVLRMIKEWDEDDR